jgi:hypothetical protein
LSQQFITDLKQVAFKQVLTLTKRLKGIITKEYRTLGKHLENLNWEKAGDRVSAGHKVITETLQYFKTVHLIMVMRFLNIHYRYFRRDHWDQALARLKIILDEDAKFAKTIEKPEFKDTVMRIRNLYCQGMS